MKKLFSAVLLSAMALSLTACDSKKVLQDNSSDSVSGEFMGFKTEYDDEIYIPDDFNATNHENPRVDYSTEEAAKIIGENSDFKLSDNFTAHVPKSLGHVSAFYTGIPPFPSGGDVLKDFHAFFEYAYPNAEFDEGYLKIDLKDTRTGEFVREAKLSDCYDEIMSDTLQPFVFFYDQRTAGEGYEKVYLFYQPPAGVGSTQISRGVYDKVGEELGVISKNTDEYFLPKTVFIGEYSPDSGESFPLLDGEISIKDAADFVTDFINKMPSVAQIYFDMCVRSVSVYKMTDDLYYYKIYVSDIYDSIPFDIEFEAQMINCHYIDRLYNTNRSHTVIDEEQFTEFLPFSEAVKITRDKMTDYVDFEVTKAELIYQKDNDLGSGNWAESRCPVNPAWEIDIYNPNDDITYHCFVNAVDGEFNYSDR